MSHQVGANDAATVVSKGLLLLLMQPARLSGRADRDGKAGRPRRLSPNFAAVCICRQSGCGSVAGQAVSRPSSEFSQSRPCLTRAPCRRHQRVRRCLPQADSSADGAHGVGTRLCVSLRNACSTHQSGMRDVPGIASQNQAPANFAVGGDPGCSRIDAES